MREEFPLVHRQLERCHAPRPAHAIACSECPEEDFISALNSRLPPQTVQARFQRAGWVVRDRGKHLCPACASKRRVEARKGEAMTTKTASPSAVDDAVRRAIPTLYLELEDKYDREAKAYKAGASDEAIAKSLGIPASIVTERRERDFGPLVESEEAKQRRESAAELKAALDVLTRATVTLNVRTDSFARAIAEEQRSLASELKVARDALEALRKVEAREAAGAA